MKKNCAEALNQHAQPLEKKATKAKYRKKADFDPSGSQNPLTSFDETWHG